MKAVDIRIRNEREAAQVAALRDLLQGAVAETTASWVWDASHLADVADALDSALLAWEMDGEVIEDQGIGGGLQVVHPGTPQ